MVPDVYTKVASSSGSISGKYRSLERWKIVEPQAEHCAGTLTGSSSNSRMSLKPAYELGSSLARSFAVVTKARLSE